MLEVFYQEINYKPSHLIAQILHDEPGFIWFDSSWKSRLQGRYSYITCSPSKTFSFKKHQNVFQKLFNSITNIKVRFNPSLPPFQCGIAGYLGYETLHSIEKISIPYDNNFDEFCAWFGLYDVVIAFDHFIKKCWILRIDIDEDSVIKFNKLLEKTASTANALNPPLQHKQLINQLYTTMDEELYKENIKKCIDYIYKGDIYQANISREFYSPLEEKIDPFNIYLSLRNKNPAPYAGYVKAGNINILSSSPELFLSLQNNKVITVPIKGTRAYHENPILNKQIKNELQKSDKDRAENLMIVDLLRNDLSKVCQPHSVKVSELFKIKTYRGIHHLISTIEGELNPGSNIFDLLRATFPGGSITGAPKIRAMQIIYELEKKARGPYCGSMGWINFNNNATFNVLIRTINHCDKKISFQVGGGIVADSLAEAEYQETRIKARKLLNTLEFDENYIPLLKI